MIGDRPPDPLRHGEGSAAVRAAQHENELVATVASYQVFRPHRGHQDLPGEVAEHCVARRMADGVVDFLEMVEVADDERERLARLTSALEFALQVGLQLTVIGDAGHRVRGGQLLGLLVGSRVLDRDDRLVRQRLQHADFASLQHPRRPHVDHEHAHDLAGEAHRNGDGALQPDPPRGGQAFDPLANQVELEHLLRALHPLGRQLATLADRRQFAPCRPAHDDVRELLVPGGLAQVQRGVGHVQDLRGGVADRPQQVVGTDRDRRQGLRDLLQGNDGLVEPVSLKHGLLAEIRILDHQRHLSRDRLQQLDVLLRQDVTGQHARDQVAGILLGPHERHHEGLLQPGQLAKDSESMPRVAGEVGNGLHPRRRLRGKAFGKLRRTQPLQLSGSLRRQADHRAHFQAVGIVACQQ